MRLTPEHRVRRSAEYKHLAGCSLRVRSEHFTVWAHGKRQGPFRMGMAVSAKVGNAVFRNRLRRRLREIVRADALPDEGMELVFVARPGAAALDFAPLEAEVKDLMRRSRERLARR